MRTLERVACATLMTLLGAIALPATATANTPQSDVAPVGYATGAVSTDDLVEFAAMKHSFSLWVTTAAKGSGAYLSDATIRIVDTTGNVVLDTTLIGPWLFVNLPRGVFTVETTFQASMQRHKVRIGGNARLQQLIVYFDTPADLSPEWVSPFQDSPYASN